MSSLLLWATYSPTSLTKWIYITVWSLASLAVIYVTIEMAMTDMNRDFDAMFGGIWLGWHRIYISPVCTVLNIVAFIPQFLLLLGHGSTGALNEKSLYWTAFVYACLAVSWPFRMHLRASTFEKGGWTLSRILEHWYSNVGWAPVDSALFASVQLVLYFIVLTSNREHSLDKLVLSESTPLLR